MVTKQLSFALLLDQQHLCMMMAEPTHTQGACLWATVGLNRNCWPLGESELVENIWAQLDRV